MLSAEEVRQLNSIGYSAIVAFTATFGLASLPEAAKSIAATAKEGFPPLIGAGSRLSDKHPGKSGVAFKLSGVFYEPNPNEEKEQIMSNVAALIAAGFLGSSYEVLKDNHYSTDPLWQFFRHLRNACFHGNKFHFRGSGPRHKAEWRGLKITSALDKTPLFFSFLLVGDVIWLLGDVTNRIGMPSGTPLYSKADPNWTF